MNKLSERDLELLYENMLDEIYGEVKIAGYEYLTSDALKQLDPTAYRCGFNDWLDSELGENIWEFEGEYFDSDPSEESEAV